MERTIPTFRLQDPLVPSSAQDVAPVQLPNEAYPGVSVIIPAYNVAAFIAETLDSVLAQTFTDYEVIVINDGSPDTEEFELVIEPYRERIRYLRQENGGASSARNAGLRIAKGAYIAFLDADDVWLPDYLEAQIQFIKEQDCDLVCADAMITGDSHDAGKTYMETLMDTAPAIGEVTFLQLVSAEQEFDNFRRGGAPRSHSRGGPLRFGSAQRARL